MARKLRFERDKDGQVIVCPVVAAEVTHAYGTSVLLKVGYARSEVELQSPRVLTFALSPQKALELGRILVSESEALLHEAGSDDAPAN